ELLVPLLRQHAIRELDAELRAGLSGPEERVLPELAAGAIARGFEGEPLEPPARGVAGVVAERCQRPFADVVVIALRVFGSRQPLEKVEALGRIDVVDLGDALARAVDRAARARDEDP